MKAECTWGEGPDVLVVLGGTGVMCYEHPTHLDRCTHGVVSQGSFDLTSKEARDLAIQLIAAANAADQLQQGFEDAMNADKKDPIDEEFLAKKFKLSIE